MSFAAAEGLPWFVLGGGCNVLFADSGFEGVVISTGVLNQTAPDRAVRGTRLTLPAGFPIPQVGRWCRDYGLSGLEFLSQIPGTVGGAVAMNAGFSRTGNRAQCVGTYVKEVRAISPDGELENLTAGELVFGYRTSNLRGFVLLQATFDLQRSAPEIVAREMQRNYEYRISVQDLRFPSAGSVFRNPNSTPLTVGQMVERIGLRGTRVGDAQISDRHGNWICNLGEATSENVLALVRLIQTEVERYFGIRLELELKVVDNAGKVLLAE